ncbi:MAG: hypothetical protein QMD92_06230 [bacterium]|nr:hypothetical protein [bacterium]
MKSESQETIKKNYTKKEKKVKKINEDELSLKRFFDMDIPTLQSHINFQGRKMVETKFGKSYWLKKKDRKDKPPSGGLTSDIDINQELQVRVSGNVQDRIFTNVDYDDAIEDSQMRQKFSVEYKGKKEEVVKEVAFGDLQLNLPNTEFVSYNKNLFGIKARADYKKLNLTAIASQTKGISESKVFKGYSEQKKADINDTSFIEKKYYQILGHYKEGVRKEHLPLELNSVKVYIDNRIGGDNQNSVTAAGYSNNKNNYYKGENSFDELHPITDYVMNYQTGIINFRKNISQNYIILVAYKSKKEKWGYSSDGTFNEDKNELLMIQANHSDVPFYNKEYYKGYEQKCYYSLGSNNINLNDKDFLLEIRDLTNKNYYDKNNDNIRDKDEDTYLYIFGLDKNKDNLVDYECIDVDFGILFFPDLTPFDLRDNESIPIVLTESEKEKLSNQELYDTINKKNKYKIHVEYKRKEKEFFLNRINIVIDSERIYLDGRLLKKDEDYIIDYFSGFITFLKEEEIGVNSEIKIDYEYMPFGGLYKKTLTGIRGNLNFSKDFFIGSTYIYEGSSEAREIPEAFSSPESLHIIDMDSKINVSSMVSNLFNLPKEWNMSISGEVAKSWHNSNTFGKAKIDNMEGIKRTQTISLNEDSWSLGRLPFNKKRGKLFYKSELYNSRAGPYNEEVGHLNDEKKKKNSLVLKYENSSLDHSVAIVNSISNSGVDFSEYKYLEVWAKIPQEAKIYIDLGMICEDADGDDVLDTEDKNNDQLLNHGEDTGWEFNDGEKTWIGKDNNKLDTEDLDKDGVLDKNENYFTVDITSNANYKSSPCPSETNSGWALYTIPCKELEKKEGDMDEKELWKTIKHIRIRVEGQGENTIYIDHISLFGNKWKEYGGEENIKVKSLNSEDNSTEYYSLKDDPKYQKEFKDLYKYIDIEKEETLVLEYKVENNKEAYAYYKFNKAQNYTGYKSFNYFIYGDGKNEEFYIWLGNNDQNYIRYKTKVNFVGWQLIKIDLVKLNSYLSKIQLEGLTTYEEGDYKICGNPSLNNINEIRLGIKGNEDTGGIWNKVWINEIHLADNVVKEGEAKRVTIDTSYKDLLNLKWSQEKIDKNFESVGRTTPSQDIKSQNIDTSLKLIKWLPLNYNFKKEETYTDPLLDPVRTIGITRSKFGKRTFIGHNIGSKFSFKKFPTVNTNYSASENENDYRNEERIENNKSLEINANYQYQFPSKIWVVPTGKELSTSLSSRYYGSIRDTKYPKESTKDSYLKGKTLGDSITINYTPFSVLSTRVLFKFEREDQKKKESYYPKFRSIGNDYKFDIYKIKGLKPQIEVNCLVSEDYLNSVSDKEVKNVKSIANFRFSDEINPVKWWSKMKFVEFHPRYSLALSANYDKISKDLDTKDIIKEVYKDYYKDKLLFGKLEYESFLKNQRKNASKTKTYNLTNNWYVWKPLELSTTYTLIKDTQQTQSSLRYQEFITYRSRFRFDLIKIFPRFKEVAQSSYFILNYSQNKSIEPNISTSISINPNSIWNINWSREFRTNLSLNYQKSKKIYTKNTTLDETITPKFLMNYTILKPMKIKVPFSKKHLYLKNKLENKLSIDAILKKEDTGQTRKKTNQYNLSLGYDYRVKESLTTEVFAKTAYFQNKSEEFKDYLSYEVSVKVEFRF